MSRQRTITDWISIANRFTQSPKSAAGFPQPFLNKLKRLLEDVDAENRGERVEELEAQYQELESKFQQRVRNHLKSQRKKAIENKEFEIFADLIANVKSSCDMNELSDTQTIRMALNMMISFFDKGVISLQKSFDAELNDEDLEIIASSEESTYEIPLESLSPETFLDLATTEKLEIIHQSGHYDQLPKRIHNSLDKIDTWLNAWVESTPQLFHMIEDEGPDDYEFQE